MKTKLLLIFSFFFISSSIYSQERKWKNITYSTDGCHNQIRVKLERRVKLYDENVYEVRAIISPSQTTFNVKVSIKGDKEGSWSRFIVPINGEKIYEFSGEYSKTDFPSFEFKDRAYIGLKLKHLTGKERYAKCGEGSNEIYLRDKNKGIKKHREEKKIKEKRELEAEKIRKQKEVNNKNSQTNQNQNSKNINSESIYDKKKREAKAVENKRLKDGMDFIDKQNKEIAEMEKSFQKFEAQLTATFSEISNNWAKEKQFQSQLASYTSINSTDSRAIIKEAKTKSQEINNTFSQRKNELLNQGTAATQKIIGAAKTEKQVIGGAVLGTGLTILGQVSAEKQRKQAQQKLEAEKEAALIKLTQPIINKFTPIAKQTLEAASFAVYEDEETYYLEQYDYAKCMIDKAYNIITSDYSCSTSKTQKPAKKINASGQDYYNAYKRKKNSSIQAMNIASETLLELAIEKEPNNAEWLYQKSLSKKITPEIKLSILNKTLEFEPNNQIYISEMLKTKELVDKRKRIDLEKEKRIDSKPFMVLKDIPIFPGCKKKNKVCFNTKINEHFNKNLNSKLFKEKNIKRLFLNLIITEKGDFIYVNSRDYDRIIISEIERIINLLPKLEPTFLNKKAIAISYSLPLRIK